MKKRGETPEISFKKLRDILRKGIIKINSKIASTGEIDHENEERVVRRNELG